MAIKDSEILDWVIKYQKGHMSKEEQAALEAWLQLDATHKERFTDTCRLYGKARGLALLKVIKKEQAWKKIHQRITIPKKRSIPAWVYNAAVIAGLLLASAWYVAYELSKVKPTHKYDFEAMAETGERRATLTLADGSRCVLSDEGEQVFDEKDGTTITKDSANNLKYQPDELQTKELIYNEVEVPRAGEYSLILADGTKVWLNADSKLRFPVRFSSGKRQVELTGEAYFEVVTNPQEPFIVQVNDCEIEVLGTKFNISGYNDQAFVATTLLEGSVKVNYLKDSQVLEPGQQSVTVKGQDGIKIQEVDAAMTMAWVNGVFEFENKDLEYICDQLGRWYNVNFFFTKPHQRNIRFTGAVKKDESIQYAIDLIERITDVKFKIEGDYIVIE
ncbi:FecR family protein [Carboxylicivirga taeanensis]|uniref:FecR family protein n=1 Tax=Carboxylicivirga taeanensis TaxID=1416875 RepID=UPI003F6DFCD4